MPGQCMDPPLLADSELQAIGQTASAVALAEVDTVVQAGGEGTDEGKNHEQPQVSIIARECPVILGNAVQRITGNTAHSKCWPSWTTAEWSPR